MAFQYTTYTTKEGDRWDLIAYAAYGALKVMITDDSGEVVERDAIDLIIQENKGIYVEPVLESGLILKIPILEFVDIEKDLLPPWKR